MKIQEKVGKRIKELRDKEGISQLKLANIADLDRTFITSVENGKRNISIINLEKIALALDVNIKSFFKGKLFD